MTGSLLLMPKNHYHVRSTSMPSRQHPLALPVQDQLHKLHAWWDTSSTSPNTTTEMLCDGLGDLRDLYDCVEGLTQSPLIQQALVGNRQEEVCVDEMLDGSLRILDLCETTRDVLKLMKENAEDLMSTLRRRRIGDSDLQNQVRDYISSRKRMQKEIEKCLKALRSAERKFSTFSPLSDKDQHLVVMIGLLREVRSITITIFQSISSCISLSMPKTKTRRESLISRWIVGGGQVACEEEIEEMGEVERVDAYLYALCGNKSGKDIKAEGVENAHKGLKAMDENLQSLQDQLDCVFRCLIKSRVSLLNILNH